MTMKNSLLLFVFLFLLGSVFAQNPPQMGSLTSTKLIVNSGANYLLIPQINDGDADVVQTISVEASSSDTTILKITSVNFEQDRTFAIVNVAEKGKLGTVTITVDVKDSDGTTSKTFDVNIGNYEKPGIRYSVYDMVFWQEIVPLSLSSVWDTVIQTARIELKNLNFKNIPITVNQDCKDVPPCTGHDFFTAGYKGYLVPPADGNYTFYLEGNDSKGFWLSQDDNHANATAILYKGTKQTAIGTDAGNNQIKSASIPLKAGKVYAIYATQWVIHTINSGILWEGPGITKSYIAGKYMMPIFDKVNPVAPKNLMVNSKGVSTLRISWDKSTDNQKVKGYVVYLDGKEITRTTETQYVITDLKASTNYSVVVASYDDMGNYSAISNIVTVTTYGSDANPPVAPTTVSATTISDMAIQITWIGATDAETEVIGYNVYVNGVKYNTSGYVYDSTFVIKNLTPTTAYNIQVEAVDAAFNLSLKSDSKQFTTIAFDPNAPSLGVKKAKVIIELNDVAVSEGIGVNPDYLNGEVANSTIVNLLKDMQPGCIRWGALTANPLSFINYSGTGKKMTYAKFMNLANEIGAYSAITTGVQNETDWMKNTETFTQFMEYLAGPSTTPQGSRRAAEGYSESLLTKSKGLIIELGCEVWGGGGLHQAEIGSNYANYGVWARNVAKKIKASPYYDSTKVFIVYSGRNPSPADSYGLHTSLLTGDKGEVDWLAVSGYLGGNFNYDPGIPASESELGYYKNAFDRVNYNLEGMKQQMTDDVQLTGELKPTYFYESNMTTPLYNGRLGQAVVMTDYMASAIELGSAIPTIFHLTGGEWKITRPAEGYRGLPLFVASKYFNRYCKGNVLKTKVESLETLTTEKGTILKLAPLGCHAYTKDGKYAILLLSRDFENDYIAQIDLPDGFTFDGNAKKYVISGTDFSTFDAVIDSSEISLHDLDLVTVPKYSMVLITFAGEKKIFDQMLVGDFKFPKIEKIKITSDNGLFNIATNKGNIVLRPEYEPKDVLLKKINWKTIKLPTIKVNSIINTDGSIKLFGTGRCDGNGTITVRAYSGTDTTVFSEVEVKISAQAPAGGCPTAIEELNSSELLVVYPNPATDRLFIENSMGSAICIRFIDISGRMLAEWKTADVTNTFDISMFKSGLYFVRIEAQNNVLTKKVIKE